MLLFIYRLIKHLLVFLLVCLPLMLIGAVLMLLVCPFIPTTQLKLPALFKWWDIVDAWIGRDTSVIQKIYAEGWWSRYCYIAWRNPINFFDYVYLGLNWTGSETYTLYNPADDDVGDGTRPGFRHIEVTQWGRSFTGYVTKDYFYEYYIIYVYPFAKHYCFRLRTGWKIGDDHNPAGTTSQWVLTCNPFEPYTGKPQ